MWKIKTVSVYWCIKLLFYPGAAAESGEFNDETLWAFTRWPWSLLVNRWPNRCALTQTKRRGAPLFRTCCWSSPRLSRKVPQSDPRGRAAPVKPCLVALGSFGASNETCSWVWPSGFNILNIPANHKYATYNLSLMGTLCPHAVGAVASYTKSEWIQQNHEGLMFGSSTAAACQSLLSWSVNLLIDIFWGVNFR